METQQKQAGNPITGLSSDIQSYVKVQTEIVRLEITNKLAIGSSVLALFFLIALILFVLVLFIGLSAGLWLSDLFGSYVKGFGLITAILLLKLLVLIVFRRKLLLHPIQNAIINSSLNDENDYESE